MPFNTFQLSGIILENLSRMGFVEPTPVQARVIPDALEGHDIRACAQTGTGKTCAFALPAIDHLLKNPPQGRPSVLIILPTRELASQVVSVIQDVGKNTKIKSALILGGMNFQRQVKQIRAGAQIIVATPGRLLDHIRQKTLSLKNVNTVVLDEGDRMLDMGFLPDIRQILSFCPSKRQTMLFSATFPPEIQRLVVSFLKDPVNVDLAPSAPAENVTQMLYPISRTQKEVFFFRLLEVAELESAIIFCRTKNGADHLARKIQQVGRSVTVLHSDRSQIQRNQAIEGFRSRQYQLLVATDIAARGLDIKDVSHVINYDVPHHPEDYVHRVGRTGRAHASGDAFTLVAPDEEPFIKRIESLIGKPIPRGAIPDFPYLVPPRLVIKSRDASETFKRIRKRIPISSRARFRR